jgi:hypothetical protein
MNNKCSHLGNLLRPFNRWIIALAGILLMTFLSSCVSMPSPGDRVVMVVTRIPTQRQHLQYYPGLSLALKRGVTRKDVKSGRLVKSGCYDEKEIHAPGTGRRHGFSFIPEGVSIKAGDIIQVTAEEADGTHYPYARFFGRYIKKYNANETDYFPYKYSVSGKEFRCGPVSPNGVMLVEAYSTTKCWDYDFAKAEELRNDQIRDKELEQGIIVIGECSPGVDSWAIWKVRIPSGLDVKVGDYIEAIAGSYEASRSLGPISEAAKKVAAPPKEDFIPTQGRYTVDCKAIAKPIIGEH